MTSLLEIHQHLLYTLVKLPIYVFVLSILLECSTIDVVFHSPFTFLFGFPPISST